MKLFVRFLISTIGWFITIALTFYILLNDGTWHFNTKFLIACLTGSIIGSIITTIYFYVNNKNK